MNSEKTIICDNNDIILEKYFDQDENENFSIYFDCNYDTSSNIIKIVEKNKFYQLLSQLNPDIIDEFALDKLDDDYSRVIIYFNEKYDDKDMVISYDEKIIKTSEKIIQIQGNENNYNDFREGYEKFSVNFVNILFTIKKERIYVKLDFVITSDDLVNDIMAMMLKKQVFRLKKYIELENE